MDDVVWTKIAKELSEGSLRELHNAIGKLVAEGETHDDIARQGGIFEREFAARSLTFDPIAFK